MSVSVDEVVLESEEDALAVLENMKLLLNQYEQVTLADFLELCGISSRFGDHKVGWTRLINIKVNEAKGGFLLDLPAPKEL